MTRRKLSEGDIVEKSRGDYRFTGTVVSAFEKLSGLTRYVVENDDGVLFILNDGQLEGVGHSARPELPDNAPLKEGDIRTNFGSTTVDGIPPGVTGRWDGDKWVPQASWNGVHWVPWGPKEYQAGILAADRGEKADE